MISPATLRFANVSHAAVGLVLVGNSIYETTLGHFTDVSSFREIMETIFITVGFVLGAACLLVAFSRGFCQSLLQTVLGYMCAYAFLALVSHEAVGIRVGNFFIYLGVAAFALGIWLRFEEEKTA